MPQGFPLVNLPSLGNEIKNETQHRVFGLPDRQATFLRLASASYLGMVGAPVLLPPAMCGLQKGYARSEDLEPLKGGLLCGGSKSSPLEKTCE